MKYWRVVAEKINQRTQRERGILLLVVLAVIYFCIDFALISPLLTEKDALQQRSTAAQQALGTYRTQEKALAQALTNDPNAGKKREIQRLQARLANLDGQLETLSTGLIAAEKLPVALHDVLNSKGRLNLLEMGTKAPTRLSLHSQYSDELSAQGDVASEVLADPGDNGGGSLTQEKVGVFKHSVFVSLEGRYFDVVSYLQALEGLSWKFYWEAIDYRVTKYPQAKVVIEVYTLSTEAGILGV